jgi:hypothetical protein
MHAARREVFVGRAREIGILQSAFAAAVSGRGRVVLLAGEPGIGKTRTAAELARRAREAGAEVLVGRCFEGDGAPAFWPWVQMLRAFTDGRDRDVLAADLGAAAPDVAAVFPELLARLPGLALAPPGDPGHARFRFFDGVTQALARAAAARPIVLSIDDLHGADEPSLRLLQFLARALSGARVLVVGGLRDFALAREHPLAGTLGELVREQVVELVRMGGLEEAEVAALLAEVAQEDPPARLVRAVRERTEGNPLYTLEVARMLAAHGGLAAAGAEQLAIPDTVRLAIGVRLRALSAGCQDLLTLAALFGREFRVDALARASGCEGSRVLALLDEAERARVLEPSSDRPAQRRFAHALLGETLAGELGAAERAETHRRLAEALIAGPYAEEHAAEIAHHWLEAGLAGDPEQAVTWSCRAAERALALLAHEEATRLYRRALEALDASGARSGAHRAELLLGLGEACKRAGRIDESKRSFLDAAVAARQLGSAELLTRAALGYAPAVTIAAQPAPDAAVVDLLEEAIAAWRGRDSGLHACALERLALAILFGDPERLVALDEQAMSMATRVGDKESLRYVLARSLSNFALQMRPGARLDKATALVALSERTGDAESLAIGRLWRLVNLIEHDEVAVMRREQPEFTRLARALRQPVWGWHARLAEVTVAFLDGRFDDAERAMEEAAAEAQSVMPFLAPAYLLSFRVYVRIFQGRAGEHADEYRRVFEAHPSPLSLSLLALVETERGNPAGARYWTERVTGSDFAHFRADLISLLAAVWIAEACALTGDRGRAAWLYDFLAPHAGRWLVMGEALPMGPVSHFLGVLARALGRLDLAEAHFEAARASAARAGSPTFLAPAQYESALLLRERGAEGDVARAVDLLAEARVTAASAGMQGLVAKIDALGAGKEGLATPKRFRRDGDFWTIAYAGKEIRLRDLRGLHYLVALLREPGRELHAADLVRSGRGPSFAPRLDAVLRVAHGTGDAGEMLDARARASYRARLAAIEEELADAERRNDSGRLERAREEREALVAELGAAARGKRASSDAERARLAATKAIKIALERIAEGHPDLGAHLHATVRRGYFCAYVPDPRHPIEWET